MACERAKLSNEQTEAKTDSTIVTSHAVTDLLRGFCKDTKIQFQNMVHLNFTKIQLKNKKKLLGGVFLHFLVE